MLTYLTEGMVALVLDYQSVSPHIEDLVSLWNGKRWFPYIYSEYRQWHCSQAATHFLLVAISILQAMESWVAARDSGYTGSCNIS